MLCTNVFPFLLVFNVMPLILLSVPCYVIEEKGKEKFPFFSS